MIPSFVRLSINSLFRLCCPFLPTAGWVPDAGKSEAEMRALLPELWAVSERAG